MTNEPNDQTAMAMRGDWGNVFVAQVLGDPRETVDCAPAVTEEMKRAGLKFHASRPMTPGIDAVGIYLAMRALEPPPLVDLYGEMNRLFQGANTQRDGAFAEVASLKEQARRLTADAHTAVERAEAAEVRATQMEISARGSELACESLHTNMLREIKGLMKDRDAWSKLCAEQATELSRLRVMIEPQPAKPNPFREFGGDRRRVGR